MKLSNERIDINILRGQASPLENSVETPFSLSEYNSNLDEWEPFRDKFAPHGTRLERSWQQEGVMGARDYTSSPILPFYKAESLDTSMIVAKHGRFKIVKRIVRVPKQSYESAGTNTTSEEVE
jgi:hypothetical protein